MSFPVPKTKSQDWLDLEAAALKVCKDIKQQPTQWIYLIDDAWFHPSRVSEEFDKASEEFSFNEANSGKGLNKAIFELKSDIVLVSLSDLKLTLESSFSSQTPVMPEGEIGPDENTSESTRALTDGDVAERLAQLATDYGYGICFCSFEYFWTHYDQINQVSNAAFFDINHALKALDVCTELKENWNEVFKAVGLFSDTTFGEPGLHGWLMHYAVKLSPDNRICRDHILLISSNFESAGGGSTSQFQTVFADIWKKVSDEKDEEAQLPESIRLSDFSYTPFLKFGDGKELIKAGFGIFDRSFQNFGDWQALRSLFVRDAYYSCLDGGHFTPDNEPPPATDLCCASWISGNDYIREMRGLFHISNTKDPITEGTVIAFLKLAIQSMNAEIQPNFPELADENSEVFLPINPGIATLIGACDLICALAATQNHENEDRIMPTVTYRSRKCVEHGKPAGIVISLPNGDNAITTLAVRANALNADNLRDPSKARVALKRLLNPGLLRFLLRDGQYEFEHDDLQSLDRVQSQNDTITFQLYYE